MPISPSPMMRALANRRLVDVVVLREPASDVVDVDPDTGRPVSTRSGVPTVGTLIAVVRASLHAPEPLLVQQPDATLSAREMFAWCSIADTELVMVGQTAQILGARDPSLIGQSGTVTAVTRESLRSVGRFTIRMGSAR
jgi:hypothetical protein